MVVKQKACTNTYGVCQRGEWRQSEWMRLHKLPLIADKGVKRSLWQASQEVEEK